MLQLQIYYYENSFWGFLTDIKFFSPLGQYLQVEKSTQTSTITVIEEVVKQNLKNFVFTKRRFETSGRNNG